MIPQKILDFVPAKTAEEVKTIKDGVIKFVKVAGEYRFVSGYFAHISLVGEGEVAEAAGTFFVFDTYIRQQDSYSSTLKIGCGEEHWNDISRIFAPRPVKGNWED